VILTIALGVICAVTTSGLFFSVKKNLAFMDKLESVEEAVEDSLKVLDEQYQKIDAKTKIEVFSDEPIIKDLVRDITEAKDSLHKIAIILDMSVSSENNQDVETI